MPDVPTRTTHIPSRSLELPEGFQSFNWNWYSGVTLNNPGSLQNSLRGETREDLYLYTQHQIFYEDAVLKHTRSSPNWDGGLVTYATCKHLMRTYDRPTWQGAWIGGLCPKDCADNCLLFVGRVAQVFPSNFLLRQYLKRLSRTVYEAKLADNNPRGDLYRPAGESLTLEEMHNHNCFHEPPNHTRSVEFYKKSPGSTSEREDGKIPKWWRDLEYLQHGRRPPCFILSPVWLFSQPMLWTSYQPKRAVLKLTPELLANSLQCK